MKRIFIVLGSIVALYSLYRVNTLAELQPADKQLNHPPYLKPIPPDKLKEDLDFLFKTIEEVHPNMYAYTSEPEFEPLRKRLYKQIDQSMNSLDFCKLAAPVVARLKSGHTRLVPLEYVTNYALANGKLFPLSVCIHGQKILIAKNNYAKQLPPGARILTINDEDAFTLLSKMAKCLSTERKTSTPRAFEREMLLATYLWIEFGPIRSIKLRVETDGLIKDYEIAPVGYKKFSEQVQREFSYRLLTEDAGLMVINLFSPARNREFKEFLQSTFAQIRKNNVTNLIIDLRKNPGGHDDLSIALLKYLTVKPFKLYKEGKLKISSPVCEKYEYVREQYGADEVGSLVDMGADFLIKPDAGPLRFKGRLYVLIGLNTGSTSMDFVAAIKHYHIGVLIGEETGDTTASYGDTACFTLPNSGLQIQIAYKYFVAIGDKNDGRWVLPDHEVKQKPEDTANGIDTVLQFTLNLIKSSEAKK